MSVGRIARATAVLAIALSAAHLAQTLAADKTTTPRILASEVRPTHIVQMSSGGGSDVIAGLPDVMPHMTTPPGKPAELAVSCTVGLRLSALPAAMIDIDLTAPCHKDQRVVLRQGPLAVTGKVDHEGRLATALPALSSDGLVAVLFGDGTRVERALEVPEAATLHRFGIQWQGSDAFTLHGMEAGAEFEQPGDIMHNNPGDPTLTQGGFLAVLGDSRVENALLAEVYTFPKDNARPSQIVLEAAVLKDTCGHDLLGEVIFSMDGQAGATDLTLAMPDCSAVGDYLVLKNLVSDLKIAAN